MKKTVIALTLAAASVSAMAETTTLINHFEGKIISNSVQVSPADFGDHTTAEFEEMGPVDITLRVIEPKSDVMYEICPVFDPKFVRHGQDSVNFGVEPHEDEGVVATFYRDDGKTPLTPEKCWIVKNAQKPISAKLVVKRLISYYGAFRLDVGFVAKPLGAR